jgi:hypothetical protein
MSILHIHKLFLSSHQGWDELALAHSTAVRLFVLLVLPFSLVPPLMLEYAGRHVGMETYPGTSSQAWNVAALFFFMAELVTVPLMAWGIREVARSKGITSEYADAFRLAAIAAVPLWLSSLALFSDQVVLIAAILALGLAGSVVLIFRGVSGILGARDELVAFDVAYIVTAMGLIAWVVLVMLGLVPAMA